MGRHEYIASHPWLKFELDLRAAQPRFWIALGEAQSKCMHIAGTPLRPEVATNLHQIYLAKGIMATTAIEGNTLTEKEVRERIERKLKLPPSREYLGKEVDNVLSACNKILDEIEKVGAKPLSKEMLKEFNSLILKDLRLEDGVIPGEFRHHNVSVGNYFGAAWQECDFLIDKFCDWLNGPEFKAPDGEEIIYGLIKSIVAHVYFVWIHPFGDGNGRTARLLEVKFLLEAGVPSAAAHLLSNHYNLTRTDYYRELAEASKSSGDLLPFMTYAVRGFVDQLREQIDIVKDQQVLIAWVNYVHQKLRDTPAEGRQRRVVLAMSHDHRIYKPSEIREITPKVAADYATRGAKTLSRDLGSLLRLGLIEKLDEGYQAKIDLMRAFLPRSINNKHKIIKRHPRPVVDLDDPQLGLDF